MNILKNDNIKNLTIHKKFKNLKYTLIKTTFIGIAFPITMLFSYDISHKISKSITYSNNKEIIKEYDDELKEYASKFDSNNMTSFEIILTVMNDIRSNTLYGVSPGTKDTIGYYRLVLNDKNNVGVCRHMADKFTTIMNLIDPRFEAYDVAVKIEDEEGYILCNIDTPMYIEPVLSHSDELIINDENIIDSDEIIIEEMEIPSNDNQTENNKKNIVDVLDLSADHLVTILKPIDEDYYLVVDVTNPSIGVVDNGKIYMFNSQKYTSFEYKPLYEQVLSKEGTYFNVNRVMLLSRFQKIDIDELNEKYGLESQNKVLEKIKNK